MNIIMTTTNTNAKLVSSIHEAMANYISRMTEDKVAEFKKGVFQNSQKELENLYKALDDKFDVNTFNTILGYNVSEELFSDADGLRHYLKEDGMSDLNKIRSFIRNDNPVAKYILNWMEGLVAEQASDIARIVAARQA